MVDKPIDEAISKLLALLESIDKGITEIVHATEGSNTEIKAALGDLGDHIAQAIGRR